MQKSKLLIVLIFAFGMVITGFQCSSTEITSARLYIQQKNYDKAQEVLEKEIEKNPKSDEGYFLLGFIYGEKEMYDKMVDAYDKSLAISKKFDQNIDDSRKSHWAKVFNAGVALYQRGNRSNDADSMEVLYDRSIEKFQQAVLLEPDSSDNYKNLAFVYISAGKLEKAEEPLQKLIDLEKSADGYRFLGEIWYDKGTKLRSEYETSGDVKDSVAAQEFFMKTIRLLEQARVEHPNNSDILLVLSNSYISANKIDVAIKAFEDGVKQEPENKYYRFNYGVLLLGADKYDDAVQQFQKAIEIDPKYENAIYNLAVTYVRWGSHLNKLAEDKGETSTEYKAKFEMALPHLEKLAEMKSDDASIWELLGRVYTILNMEQDATNAYNKADQLRN